MKRNTFFKLSIFISIFFLNSCQKKDGEDPFNPVYDLGLSAATQADLADASSILPSFFTGVLPSTFALNMPPVNNQGKQSSCVAFASGYAAMSYYINKKNNGNYEASNNGSPKFLYNLSKISGCENGSIFPRALGVLKTKGICTFSQMPYNDGECSLQPSASQYASAQQYKIQSWSVIPLSEVEKMKRLLVAGNPLLVGISAYDNLFRYTGGVYNSLSGKNGGGHAVCIVGYNENMQAFKIQNSWGSAWGEGGYFWVSYNFLQQQLALEGFCYVMKPAF